MNKDLQKRVIFGAIAFLIFLIPLWTGGLFFQLFVGLLAMLAVAELSRMQGVAPNSIEGVLAMLAALVLTIPLEKYIGFLPIDGNYTAYAIVVFILLGCTVLKSQTYSFSEAVFPITNSFYVGIGFHNLVAARSNSLAMVFFALFIVWATDIGAYMIGRQLGRHKLMPAVSPNKTIEGSAGGVLSAVVVSAIFLIFKRSLAAHFGFIGTLLLVVLFSIFAQFGDLVESAIKRRFGVKDSGKIIPGHGGILDRFDSMIFVFPIMHFFGLF